jgi:hypothetical protein
MTRHFLKLLTSGALLLLCVAPCLAQYSTPDEPETTSISPGASLTPQYIAKVGDLIQIDTWNIVVQEHDVKVTKGSSPEVYYLSSFLVKNGTKGTINGKPVIFHANKRLSVSFYPLGLFSVAGPVYAGGGSIKAGTDTSNGFIVDVDASQHLKDRSTFEYGGFYYHEFPSGFPASGSGDNRNGNLYEFHIRYLRDGVGYQLAYLNDDHNESEGLTAYLLFDVVGRSTGPAGLKPDAKTWYMRVGLGAYNNLSKGARNPTLQTGSVFESRSSVNPSVYWQASYALNKRTSLLFSTWWVRNRSQDTTRFAFGVGYKF